jgi:sec-independent protein translocase protein TatA
MFGGKVGWPEIVLVLVIVLIIFGAGKLPGIGKALGESIREFKSSSKGDTTSLTDEEKALALKQASEAKASAKQDKA